MVLYKFYLLYKYFTMNSISKKVLKTHTIVTVQKGLFNFLLKKKMTDKWFYIHLKKRSHQNVNNYI